MIIADRGILQDASVPPAVAGILQNLSSRPNVESTLVLSRSDGSIICATGSISPSQQANVGGRPVSAALSATRDSTTNEVANEPESASEAEEVTPQSKAAMGPAELLASSVLSFVHSATLLGRAAGRSNDDPESQDAARAGFYETAPNQEADDQEQNGDSESAGREDQIQLLRLRTRRQEVIIYPDTKYLCCVVQSVGKQANGAT